MLTLNEQQLINLMQPDLPIKVFPERELLATLRGKYSGIDIGTSTEFEIRKVLHLGEMGGVGCELVPTGYDIKKAEAVVLCSITHLRIKKGQPHYAEMTRYQVKRIKKLKRQNRFN